MATVSKRKWTSPDGAAKEAWCVRYVDQAGKQRQRTFERKKDADAYRLQVETEKNAMLHVAASQSVTVGKLAQEYLEAAEARNRDGRRMSDAHLHSLKCGFRKHIVPALGGVLLRDLTFATVCAWGAQLSGTGIVPASVKQKLYFLKAAIDFGMRRGYVHRNVAAEAMKEYRGGVRKPIRTFTVDEVRALLAASGERPFGHTERAIRLMQCYAHIAAFAGLRFGEISGLTVENVDFKNGVIQVRHALTQTDVLKGPKTKAGIRDVPMASVVSDLIRDWLARFYVPNERGLIFRGPNGVMLSPQTFHSNHWKRCLKRAGLEPEGGKDWHHFHALRHFCASAMIDANVPLTDVASLLGHSAFDVTLQVYAHTIAGGRRRSEALENIAASVVQPLCIAQELRTAA